MSPLPDNYLALLELLKDRVRKARLKAQRTVNTELIELYWNIGHEILTRQEEQGWGSGVVKRLAEDLRAEFPDMTGLSQRNLQYMRSMAEAWGSDPNVPQLVAQLPWGHIMVLIDKVESPQIDRAHRNSAVQFHSAAGCSRFGAGPTSRERSLRV